MEHKTQPFDPRTKALLIGAAVGTLAVVAMSAAGLRDERSPVTGLFVAAIAPMWMTIRQVERYAPRVRPVQRRELWNLPLGAPLGILALFAWQLFGPAFTAVEAYLWESQPVDPDALAEIQFMSDNVVRPFVSLLGFTALLAMQAALWVIPTYWMARWVNGPVERQLEAYYKKELRRRAQELVELSNRLARFKTGGELAETKIQLRTYGTVLGLCGGLVAMTLFVWVAPLVR
ncbi:MAG: hypothetical protein FJ144_27230 [Deltaproteobacteria bacterium]|nr:hypothetical protein [Deltaproteobacteria bacterium]